VGRDCAISHTERVSLPRELSLRSRHAIYHPYGGGKPPPGAAKELYLVPLRVTDELPDFTSLFDGFRLHRTRSIFIGVFIANKEAPPVHNDLQALMSSLNPSAIQGLLARAPAPAAPTSYGQYQYPQYPAYPPHNNAWEQGDYGWRRY
jgi:hypothetical protein